MSEQLTCRVCGYGSGVHKWTPRKGPTPVSCPRCKSYQWDGKSWADKRGGEHLEDDPLHQYDTNSERK